MSIDELKQAHSAAHDRATAAQAAIAEALTRVGDEVVRRVADLDAANVALANAGQAVTNAGGAVPPHADIPRLKTPTSSEMRGLLLDVLALPARAVAAAAHQAAIEYNDANAATYTAEVEARRYQEKLASPPASQATPRMVPT